MMPAMRTYLVTRTQVVSVHSACGHAAALAIATQAFDGKGRALEFDEKGYADAMPSTTDIHIDRKN